MLVPCLRIGAMGVREERVAECCQSRRLSADRSPEPKALAVDLEELAMCSSGACPAG